ncbi:AMP-binding protein [Gynuella sunshinyii]|uniref:Acyl-CoA synthetase (AMP-forming)/AMP-acid ligase II n=1 Tax=Gynuella sunshinyii YC6258 TaxID=1445510 RepID=A0A0C5V7S6_9GAMM|nr:AMP-binding protein [Gynuella sunshinyii]AJQ95475.1 acyl-CoA synthetase (AMP-forming)/AMP-acid ligase II [Gynuella sunshinyii YC6258]
MSLHNPLDWIALLQQQAEQYHDKVCFEYSANGESVTDSITFVQLDQRARALAVQLGSQLNTGERAILMMPNSIEYIVGFFACVYAGIIAVTAYPPQSRRRDWGRLSAIARDCQASQIICLDQHMGTVEEWLSSESLTCGITTVPAQADMAAVNDWHRPAVQGDDLVFLQYSSGSTGMPKGVMLSHANLLANSRLIQQRLQFSAQRSCVSWLPMYHDMGFVGYVLTPLLSGSTVRLLPPPLVVQSPYLWLKAISDCRAAISGGPNFIFDHCASRITQTQLASLDLSCWKIIPNGAEPILAATLQRFEQTFAGTGLAPEAMKPSYGMAEACLFVTTTPIGECYRLCPGDAVQWVSSGQLHEALDIRIVDPETLELQPEGGSGEICFRGESVSRGYWARDELNQQVFNQTIAAEPGYFRTGDLGFIRDGYLYVSGRLKEMLIVRGNNYFPQDIEATVQAVDHDLTDHGGAVFAVNQAGQPEQLVLVQELSRQGSRRDDLEQLIYRIRQTVTETHDISLSAVVLISPASLAKTTSGKIQRLRCRELFLAAELKVIHQWQASAYSEDEPTVVLPSLMAPVTASAIETWICHWAAQQTKLPLNSIDATQPLSASGLDSVDAMTLNDALSQALQQEIDPELIWQSDTISALAQGVVAAMGQPGPDSSETMIEGEI